MQKYLRDNLYLGDGESGIVCFKNDEKKGEQGRLELPRVVLVAPDNIEGYN